MDPNATLDEIRAWFQANETEGAEPDMAELVELWEALDQWMSRGGFSPWATVAQT